MRDLVFCALVFLGIANYDAAATEPALDYGDGAGHWALEWSGPDGQKAMAGLSFVKFNRQAQVSRYLIELPNKTRLVVTTTVMAREGIYHTEVKDDSSGWWVLLEMGTNITGATMGEFYANGRDYLINGQGVMVPMALLSKDGTISKQDIELDENMDQIFAEKASTAPKTADFLASMPMGISSAVFFLSDSLRTQPDLISHPLFGTDSIFKVLARLLQEVEPHPRASGEGWSMTSSRPFKGVYLSDPDLLEFTARFHSVENADPLADMHAYLRAQEAP